MLSILGGINFYNIDKIQKLPFESMPSPEYVYLRIPDEYSINVQKGAKVCIGEAVAFADGEFCPPIRSSVSGTVEEISDNFITVKNDFELKNMDGSTIDSSIFELSEKDIQNLADLYCIYDNSVPLSKKLNDSMGNVENIIINAVDSEPTEGTLRHIILDHIDELIKGIKIVIHAVKARVGIITLGDTCEDLLKLIQNHITDPNLISTRIIESKYPSSNSKCLVFALTRKEYSEENFVEESKCLVLKGETVVNLYHCISQGIPFTKKLITVSGRVNNPKNILVSIGAKIDDIIKYCGGSTSDNYIILKNGIMTGTQVLANDVIDYDTNSITLIKKQEYLAKKCIRCGRCVDICPMLLKPLSLYANIIYGKAENNEHLGIKQCIGCGCCSYVCPSKIPLANTIFGSSNKTNL